MRQKSALGHKWILMYCVIEGEWLKCLVSDNELLELEHLPTTTVKPVGVEVSHTYIHTDRLLELEHLPTTTVKPVGVET